MANHLSELSVDGKVITRAPQLATAFDDYVCNAGRVLSNNVIQPETDFVNFRNHDVNLDFSFEAIDESVLEVVVSNMKSTGLGYDDDPMFIHKDKFHLLSTVMMFICNLSLFVASFLTV